MKIKNKLLLFSLIFLKFSCCKIQNGFYRDLKESSSYIFYQILVDRFYDGDKTNNYKVDISNPYGFHGGDIRGILDKIGYLSDLGINAVIISPIIDNIDGYVDFMNYKHYGYHGYWPENFEMIEEHFGDFKIVSKMSSELHKSGIVYIQDIVLNHSGYKSFWEKNTLWVRSLKYGGCVDNDEFKQCLFGLPDFKTEREDVRRYLIKMYKELMRKVSFDGLRIDAMKHIEPDFVRELREDLIKLNPNIILIGEYWGSAPNDNGLLILSNYKVDFLFDFEFRDYVSGFLRGVMRVDSFVSYLNKRYEIAQKGFLVFLNNHDLNGILTDFEIENEKEEGRLLRLMALLQFLCGGIPLIYYGEENGISVGRSIENRRDMQFSERIVGIRDFYKFLITHKKKGIFSGKFEARNENGILVLRMKNSYGEILAFINREREEKEVLFKDKNYKIPAIDYLLLRISEGAIEFLLPH